MFARTAVARTVARTGAKRGMSDAPAPKMHKFKDTYKTLEATRPPPDPHPHLVFHPPYNPTVTGVALVTVLTLGYGTMYFGMRHQQVKQGYWK